MQDKKTKKTKASRAKKDMGQSHEYETMSQAQNRYGKGRKHSGSDGSTYNSNFSNH